MAFVKDFNSQNDKAFVPDWYMYAEIVNLPTQMKTDNELIAEFMGFSCCDTGQDRFWNPPSQPKATVDSWEYHTNHLDEFRTSWDWLMPVIHKIANFTPKQLNGWVMEYAVIMQAPLALTPIDVAYTMVVNFIKWYNSQSSKPEK